MDFETACRKKGGIFEEGSGCLIEDKAVRKADFPHRDGKRLFYETSKTQCEKNGDEYVLFSPVPFSETVGLHACKELGSSEFCEKSTKWKNKHNIPAIGTEERAIGWENNYRQQLTSCMTEVQFPDHKLDQLITHADDSVIRVAIENQKLPSSLITRIITEKTELLRDLYGAEGEKPHQHLSSENIDLALAKGEDLRELYNNHKLSQRQIEKAIEIGKNLEFLYDHHILNTRNISLAITKGEALYKLFQFQRMTTEQITIAMNSTHVRNQDLATLYEHQPLNQAQIEKAIESNKGQLLGLCRNKKVRLTTKQIDKILNQSNYISSTQRDLRALYDHYTLSSRQIDHAITKGVALDSLVLSQHLSDKQIIRIIKTCEGEELYQLYSKKGAMKPEHVDLALETNRNYIAMLYQYQNMTPSQIDKALDIGINREAIYTHKKLTGEQITKALKYELESTENELQKKQLFTHQKLFNYHIDQIIRETKKAEDQATLRMMLESQPKRLTKEQMKDVINFADDLEAKDHYQTGDIVDALYQTQDVDADIINYCIKKDVALQMIYISHADKFSSQNVENAMNHGKYLTELYTNVELSSQQITNALMKEQFVGALIQSRVNIISTKQIEFIIEHGNKEDISVLYKTYTRGDREKRLDVKHVDIAIERGEELDELYQKNVLESYQIDNAIGKGQDLYHLYCNHDNKFTNFNFKNAIQVHAELDNLYTCQKNLPSDIIDRALEEGISLHELYEHQKLNSNQLFRALAMKQELPQLYAYQIQHFTSAHFDLLIPVADENLLYKMYTDTALKLSDEQREQVAKKISDELGMVIPPASIVHTRLSPKFWKEFEEKKQRSINERLKERPLVPVLGVYPLSIMNPWQDIIDIMDDKGYMVSDDGKYAVSKADPKKHVRIGKILFRELKTEHHPLMKKYKTLMSQKIRPFHYTTNALPKDIIENLEIVISDDPNDIAAKGTGHQNIGEGCETVQSGSYGWIEWTKEELEGKKTPPHHGCGWCDDIKNNNAIAFIRNKTEKNPRKKWLDRTVIRWCLREDDKKPDAIIETIYGQEKYKPMLKQVLTDILNKHGFTGETDGHICTTPYKYTGYADHATHRYPWDDYNKPQVIKSYKIGPRPTGNSK
jgi:hypothetical protein